MSDYFSYITDEKLYSVLKTCWLEGGYERAHKLLYMMFNAELVADGKSVVVAKKLLDAAVILEKCRPTDEELAAYELMRL